MNFDFRTALSPLISLAGALSEIEAAQLVRRLQDTELAYLFKHALVQDTAYSSLMRHDRRRLHRLVAQALEQQNPERLAEFAPLLGQHYREAGEPARALHYFRLVADAGAARYENREALAYYTQAIDAAEELESPERAALYRARGQVYERTGEFEAARRDLETALRLARQQGDVRVEWQSLLDLGFAWSARDYARAGEYFERALDLARQHNDPTLVAPSLNRVGNWYLNNEAPEQARDYHREALASFEQMGDERGIAETEDLLGMTEIIGGNVQASRTYFARALGRFRKLDDVRGIASTLISVHLQDASLQLDLLPLIPPFGEMEQGLTQALQLTRELGWRAGESFALWVFGEVYAAIGQFGRGMQLLQQAVALASEIDHRQWLAAATMLVGAIYSELLDYATGEKHLETALALARETGSLHWIRSASGFLASNLIAQDKLDEAHRVLDAAAATDTPLRTLGQRQVAAARIELALARRQPATALYWLESLWRSTANLTPETVLPRVWQLRARAYLQIDRVPGAAALLADALETAQRHNLRPAVWHIQCDLARVYRTLGQEAQAAQAAAAARQLIDEMAATIENEALRGAFHARAVERIPQS